MLPLTLILIAGCSEETVTPEVAPFTLNLIVTDTAGEQCDVVLNVYNVEDG